MATGTTTAAIGPIESVLGDVFASLAVAAHAYLADSGDLAAAEISIDLAAQTYERIAPRLKTEERLQMAALLTELRMTFVRKRGL